MLYGCATTKVHSNEPPALVPHEKLDSFGLFDFFKDRKGLDFSRGQPPSADGFPFATKTVLRMTFFNEQ